VIRLALKRRPDSMTNSRRAQVALDPASPRSSRSCCVRAVRSRGEQLDRHVGQPLQLLLPLDDLLR